MNNFNNFLSHLNSFGSHKLFHSGRLNEQDGPIEPPPTETETPPLRSGIDKYKYGDGVLLQYDQYGTPKAPTATDQDEPIEPPRTEEPEPFVGPPSPQSNKPSISPSPRSQRDNWNEDPYFKDAETVQGVNDANGVVAPTGKPNTTHFMKSMPFYPAKEKKSSPYKNGQFINPIKDTNNPNKYEEEFKEAPRDAMGNLLEANNITNFADHMKFLSFYSGRLNEEDTSYDDGSDDEGDEEVIMNDRSSYEDNPLSPKIKANAEKAWEYRNAGYAANKIKSSWNELNTLQKNQIKDLAKQKGRDWSEMDHLGLNETSNHNIFLNYLNLFSK